MASIRGTSAWAARVAGAKQAKMDHVGTVNAMFLHQDKSPRCSEKPTRPQCPLSRISNPVVSVSVECGQWRVVWSGDAPE